MTDYRGLFDLATAAAIFLLALLGIFLRVRRMINLNRIILVEPIDQRDIDYLASVKRSTWLRLGTKVVFFLGSLIMLFDLDALWAFWRIGIVVSLVLMAVETHSVDTVRDRLGKAAESG